MDGPEKWAEIRHSSDGGRKKRRVFNRSTGYQTSGSPPRGDLSALGGSASSREWPAAQRERSEAVWSQRREKADGPSFPFFWGSRQSRAQGWSSESNNGIDENGNRGEL